MAWIQVDQTIRDNRKIYALSEALDIEPAHAVGLMVTLWTWAVDNAPDGDLKDISDRTLARASGWCGDPAALRDALESTELITGGDIHDWDQYTGGMLKEKAADAERKRREREKRKSGPSAHQESPSGASFGLAGGSRTNPGQSEDKSRTIPGQSTKCPPQDKDIDKEKEAEVMNQSASVSDSLCIGLEGESEGDGACAPPPAESAPAKAPPKRKPRGAAARKKKQDTMIRIYEDMKAYYAQGAISDALDTEIRKWFAYRAEINKPIEETGMSSLLAKSTDAAMEYGDTAVIDLIETSIVSGWQGIFFERLASQNPRGRPPGKRDDAPRSQTYDFGSLEQALNEPQAAGG